MNTKLPITRISKFFSQNDFDFNIEIGQEYLNGDVNMKVILYRVNRQKTDTDDVYAEVGFDETKFFPPVEVNGRVKIDEPKNTSYKSGIMRYLEPGNLIFDVYLSELDKLNVDINYGDYVGYQESETKTRFYTVTNDGKVVSDTKHNMFGYKPYYRTITCSVVQDQQFRGV